ncbi:MAG TPA: SHOCT domain-containing protein [Thermomicrobiales bacterium]|nr:SHOCT domain-containing protein [Thermomicrobiales bacterium]HRA48542.1 SHOCT domain-containing protein [Thermomicrobiales bacterium]
MSLLRTAAHVGVATSVHGRVNRRQQQKFATQVAAQQAQAAPAPAPAPAAAPTSATSFDEKVAQLKQLGELRDAGILTEVEFEVKKAQILNG